MPSERSKRRDISVETILKTVKRNKRGEKSYHLEKDTGFQRTQIKTWAKDEQGYISLRGNRKRKKRSGFGPKPKFEEVEKHLFTWFRYEREKNHQVNYNRLREKAKEIAKELNIGEFFCSTSGFLIQQVATLLVIHRHHHTSSTE